MDEDLICDDRAEGQPTVKVRRHPALRLLRGFALCLAAVVFLLVTVTMLGSIFKNDKQLSPWGTGLFIIATGSMEPGLPVGTLVFVASVPADRIKKDDIVTFFAPNMQDIVTHRVVKAVSGDDGYIYTTRGDANETNDPPIEYDRVIGRVVFSLAGMSSLSALFRNVTYFGAAIIVVGVVLCVFGVLNERRKNKK